MHKTEQIIFLFIIIFTVLFLLLSSFIVFIVYRYKQKQNAHTQALQSIQVSHENALLQAQLEMQEQTFVNISREIHDNVGQKLAFAKLQLVTLAGNGQAALVEPINIISKTIADLSDLSRTLNADALLANGFINAVAFEVQQLQKVVGFSIDLEIMGETVFLADKQELILYRIIQETLHNIVKHAAPTEVHVIIHFQPNCMSISVQDNGKGFDTKAKHKGMGLRNTQERVKLLGGDYHVKSFLKIGTNVTINIPIHGYNKA
jgi:two-component system, NarL family, sensor kinase